MSLVRLVCGVLGAHAEPRFPYLDCLHERDVRHLPAAPVLEGHEQVEEEEEEGDEETQPALVVWVARVSARARRIGRRLGCWRPGRRTTAA